jgi:hypothetical protein
MDDLFSRLFRYLPTEKSSPLENYLTEIFAYLLKKSEAFKSNFFGLIGIGEAEINTISENDIQTQVVKKDNTFDILISNDNLEIIIENKVESEFGKGQMEKYRKYLNSIEKKLTQLVTITKSPEYEGLDYADCKITWYEIYKKLLEDKMISNYEERYIDYFLSLKNFLREKDMGIEKITWEIARGIEAEKNLINQIDLVFNELAGKEFKEFVRIKASYGAYNRSLSFYFLKQLSNNSLELNFYYILSRVAIFCTTNKKNLKNPAEFPTADWDLNYSEISRFEITKERFLGLELNEQIEALKSWGRTCIQKFLDNLKAD